jgi:hypothetical protein
MNVFLTSFSTMNSAISLDDVRLGAQIREGVQILSNVIHKHSNIKTDVFIGEGKLCKPFNPNHPVVLWAEERAANYRHLRQFVYDCCDEFNFRFGHEHKAGLRMQEIALWKVYPKDEVPAITEAKFISLPKSNMMSTPGCARHVEKGIDFTDFKFPDDYREYLKYKWKNQDIRYPASWTNRKPPMWFK